jgi:hypothetical protein
VLAAPVGVETRPKTFELMSLRETQPNEYLVENGRGGMEKPSGLRISLKSA